MIHIQPISERLASVQVQTLYHDIKTVLKTETVPLYFQYMANFDDVCGCLWSQMKDHIEGKEFNEAVESIVRESLKIVIRVYQPTPDLVEFIAHMNPEEREKRSSDVLNLLSVSAKMLLIEIQLREAIKGMPIVPLKELKLLESSEGQGVGESENSDNSENSKIVGSSELAIAENPVQYDSFFEKVEGEMRRLVSQKNYLESRVEFERDVQFKLVSGAFPLQISYNEFRNLMAGKSYIDEFLFLMKDVFPSNAPRQVFTAALMSYILNTD